MRRRKDDLELDIVDVNSGNTLFTKAMNWPVQVFNFMFVDQSQLMQFRRPPNIRLHFSPDSHYLLAGTADSAVGYDLQAQHEVGLPGRIKQMATSTFTFTANNDLAAYNSQNPSRSQIVRFPSGDLVQEFPLEINGFKLQGRLIAPAKGNYILVTPAAMHPIAAIDLEKKKLATGYKSPGMAVYGDLIAGEQLGGRIALFSMAEQKQLAGTQLPLSYLPSLRASGFSPDGKWLAAAGETSGGVWNVETGERVLDTGTFAGGYFDEGKILATFHKLEARPKMVSLDPVAKTRTELFDIGNEAPATKKKDEERERIWQAGDLVFSAMPPVKGRTTIAAHDARNNQVRWTREFPGFLPNMTYSRSGKSLTAVFQFMAIAKDEIKIDPELKQKYAALPNKDYAILIEVLDPLTGKTRGSIFVDTANYSFSGNSAITCGDTVLFYDTHNRTLVYSLSSGQQRGKVVGKFRALSAEGDQMLIENEAGVAELYSTSTLQPLEKYTFPARITHAEFVDSGRIMILAADQTIYEIKVPAGTVARNDQ
jgi:hypothetical protein